MTFTVDFNKAIKNVKGFNRDVVRGSFLDMSGRIIKDTPVGNPSLWIVFDKSKARYVDFLSVRDAGGYVGGSLRGNWNASIRTPDRSRDSQPDKSGNETIARMGAAVASYQSGQTLYLTNTLPYADKVEFGHSTQAPHGMVRKNIRNFNRALTRAVKRGSI